MLDSLLKNLGKIHFKYLSQEFDNNVLELTKPKKRLSLWMHELFWKVISKNISHKLYDHVLMFGIWKRNESDERLSRLSLTC